VTLTWRPLADDIPAIAGLAGRCLAVDGGLPLVADESFLRRRFAGDGVTGLVAEAADGTVGAAVAVRPQDSGKSVAVGLVDPAVRGQGAGSRLLDFALEAGVATVETEALTDAAAGLFESRGLRQVWAEDIMRYDLRSALPAIALPAGVLVTPWTDDVQSRFFAVSEASCRGGPGFPGWPRDTWVEWTGRDAEWRADWSLLATDGDDLGFITAGEGWIVQVGVRPEARGRAIGAGLVAESMRRMRLSGGTEVLLDVNVDNPAGDLYRRLGFTTVGRRARFSS
jgi:mycothiol synthase